jgi:hypothetical protein
MRNFPSNRRAWLYGTRADLIVAILLLALCLLFFWRILTPVLADRGSFSHGDFDLQFYAFSTYEARELLSGRVPLWNPYTFSGAPFLADIQSAIFYPLSLATILLSTPWGFSLFALEVEAVAHFFLSSLFMYLFMRRILSRAYRETRRETGFYPEPPLYCRGAALVAAVTFTYGGYLTSYPSQQLAVLEVVTWLPLILLLLDMAVEHQGRAGIRPCNQDLPEPASTSREHGWIRRLCLLFPSRPLTLAGVALGLALLAGHPQSAMFVTYTSTLYFFWRCYNARRYWAAVLGGWLWWLVIGFGLAAIDLVPGLEYLRLSVRAAGTYEKMAGGFPVYDVIQVLLPGSVSIMSPLYVGILPLTLAAYALWMRRQRETLFWGVLGAVALLLSFGGNTFFYSLLYLGLPGFSIFRGQERAAMIISFCLAVLVGYGALGLARAVSRAARSRYACFRNQVGYLFLGSLGLVVLFFYALNQAGWQAGSPFYTLLGKSVLLALLAGLAWGIYHLRWLGLLRRSSLMAAVLALVIFDLFTTNWENNFQHLLPEERTKPPPEVLVIRQDPGIYRVYNEYRLDGNYGDPFAIEDLWGASPERLQRYDRFINALPIERVWQLLNVKYVITWRKTLVPPSQVLYQRQVAENDITYVHRLDAAYVGPRAWIIHHVEVIPGDEEALARLAAADFAPFAAAVLSQDIGLTMPDSVASPSSVQVLERSPSHLALQVDPGADGLLVVSEVFYPGWRASVDGLETTIYPVDYVLRGVKVSAGSHRVEMVYDPWTWKAGVAVSLVFILLVAGALSLGPCR